MNILSFGDISRCNEETSFRALLILPLVDAESSFLHNMVRLWESCQIHRREEFLTPRQVTKLPKEAHKVYLSKW